MALSPGFRLGPYEILSPLGAGGMGEVYRAKDSRLGREVAIKVLPSHLAERPELKQRFEREAKAISQLTHPHICTLYDVGSQDGVEYLVMELLNGESLADSLGKGALPRDQVIQLGIEITEALEKAHRSGIIHRDLKPGNIMLTKSGVKLLDFGLAKIATAALLPEEASSLPTQGVPDQPLTEKGTVMGTFQYMAPEQLEGAEADARTDIFALGAVLYEMATGRKAFTGKSRVSLIGSILKDEPPPISSIQPMTPPVLDRVVQTCLAKDPDDRFQTAHDVKLQLRWIAESGSQAGAPVIVQSRRKSREHLAWATASIAAAAALLLTALHFGNPPRRPRTIRTSILPPEKSAFAFDNGAMTFSPDGTRLAFLARSPDGTNRLWIRPLDGTSAVALAGTDDASYPFWSPDGRFLGFFAGGALKKIDTIGGPPQALCDAPGGRGATWNRDGVIVFAPSGRGPLLKISSAGGTPTPVSQLDATRGELSHRFPSFLPDGRHFLYLAYSLRGIHGKDSDTVYAGSLDSKERRVVVLAQSNAIYTPTSTGASRGYLLYWRDRAVIAQPFDPNTLSSKGDPVSIGASSGFFDNIGLAAFAASNAGMLAYQPRGSGDSTQPIWFDRTGKQLEALATPADYRRVRLSHDGRRVAADVVDPRTGLIDIWIFDLVRHDSTRLTFGPTDNYHPVWSPDDRQIAFSSNRQGMSDIYRKASSGSGREELLVPHDDDWKGLTDWSADGKVLTYSAIGANANAKWDIFTFSLAEMAKVPVLKTPANEYSGTFSPDGRWFAYVSEESGRPEVYVQAFPPAGGKWQISSAGGSQPAWSLGGKEIYFLSADNRIMAAEVGTTAGFEVSTPRPLFETRIRTTGGRTLGRRYDVSADGRFLITTAIDVTEAVPITLVQNWAAELEK